MQTESSGSTRSDGERIVSRAESLGISSERVRRALGLSTQAAGRPALPASGPSRLARFARRMKRSS